MKKDSPLHLMGLYGLIITFCTFAVVTVFAAANIVDAV